MNFLLNKLPNNHSGYIKKSFNTTGGKDTGGKDTGDENTGDISLDTVVASKRVRNKSLKLLVEYTEMEHLFEVIYNLEQERPTLLEENPGIFLSLGRKIFGETDYSLALKLYKGFKAEKENAKLKQQIKRLEEELITRSELSAANVHDINNLLAGISGMAQLGFELPRDIEWYIKTLRYIYEKTLELNNLTIDLVGIWKVLSTPNVIELEKTNTNMLDFVKKIVEEQTPYIQIQRKEISINLDIDKSIEVQIDKNLFTRVINNLLHNSIKFIQGKGKINIIGKLVNDSFVLEIIDDGIIVNPNHIKMIFGFGNQSGDSESKNKGMGIGLAFVSKIVKLHNGDIEAEIKEPKGLGIKMILPIE